MAQNVNPFEAAASPRKAKPVLPLFDDAPDFDNGDALQAFTALKSPKSSQITSPKIASTKASDASKSFDIPVEGSSPRKASKAHERKASNSDLPEPKKSLKTRNSIGGSPRAEVILPEPEPVNQESPQTPKKKKAPKRSMSINSNDSSVKRIEKELPKKMEIIQDLDSHKEAEVEEDEEENSKKTKRKDSNGKKMQRSLSVGRSSLGSFSSPSNSRKTSNATENVGSIGVMSPRNGGTLSEHKIDEENVPEATPSNEEGVKDAWEKMQEGTCMMKFGKHGNPHFRFFCLNDEKNAIIFFSKGKPKKQTTLEINQIEELRFGLNSKGFERHYYFAKDYKEWAFSLLFDKGQKSLDIIAPNNHEFLIWTKGLQSLIDEAKNPSGLVNGCMVELKNAKSKKKIADASKYTVRERKAILVDVQTITKQYGEIKSRMEDKRILHVYIRSETWPHISFLLEKIQKLGDLPVDEMNLVDLDYEVWWAQICMECLNNIIAVGDAHV
jgi:hypothetical protein